MDYIVEMPRPSPFLWFALISILLLPTAAGRVLLDLAGGLLLVALALPILLTGAGWLGWRYLQTRLKTCEVCGTSTISQSIQCPICGSNFATKQSNQNYEQNNSIPASDKTIDITAKEAD